jgi:hypothetical protein
LSLMKLEEIFQMGRELQESSAMFPYCRNPLPLRLWKSPNSPT